MAMKALVFTLIVSANMAHGIDVRKLVGGMREQRAMAAHDDASTGTVTEVTKEQEAVGHAALTCDSIMAKSLVLANEQKAHAEVRRDEVLAAHTMALAQITKLEEELSSMNKTLASTTNELEFWRHNSEEVQKSTTRKYEIIVDKMTKDAEEHLNSALRDSVKAIEGLKDEVKNIQAATDAAMEAAKAEWESIQIQLNNDAQNKIAEAHQQNQQLVLTMEQAHTQTIAQMARDIKDVQELAKQEIEDLQKATASRIKELIIKHEDEHEMKDSLIANIKKDAAEFLATVKSENEEMIIKLTAEKEASLHSLQAQHEREISNLKKIIERLEDSAKKDLDVAKHKASEALAEAKRNAELTLKETNSIHAQFVSTLTASKASLQTKVDGLEKRNKRLDKRLSDASLVSTYFLLSRRSFKPSSHRFPQELANWEQLYRSRSFCNFTYIHEETTAAMITAATMATGKVGAITGHATKFMKQASESHLEKTRELYNEHLKQYVDKLCQKTREMYDKILKEHVDKHFRPFQENHLRPLIKLTGIQIRAVMKRVGDGAAWVQRRLVNEFKLICSHARRELKNYNAPVLVIEYTNQQCRKPREAVNLFVQILLTILALFFRKAIWRTANFVILFPFHVAFIPLRFLFGSSKPSENPGDPASSTIIKSEKHQTDLLSNLDK